MLNTTMATAMSTKASAIRTDYSLAERDRERCGNLRTKRDSD
jgi:hypothetical protein